MKMWWRRFLLLLTLVCMVTSDGSSADDGGVVSDGIHVIGAGLGRTGTKSLQSALEVLGYKTYHFVSPSHAALWAAYARGSATSGDVLDRITNEGYTATCDNPTADLFAEQLKQYPNARVVLTVRDSPERWEESWKVLMEFIRVQEQPFSLLFPSFLQWIPFLRDWKAMRSIMGTHIGLPPGELIRNWHNYPGGWLAHQYEAHNAKVTVSVPTEQLLRFNVKEGWGPLCTFLGKPVPDMPFPNVNESADLEFGRQLMIFIAYAWIPFVILVGFVLRVCCCRWGTNQSKDKEN